MIETPRFSLRLPDLKDAPSVFEFANDPEVVKYLVWRRHQEIAESVRFIENGRAHWLFEEARPYSIVDKASGQIAGLAEVRRKKFVATVGYVLARPYWGQGAMTEILQAMMKELSAAPNVWRVEAHCHPDNAASRRVLEKAGLRMERICRAHAIFPNLSAMPQDAILYALDTANSCDVLVAEACPARAEGPASPARASQWLRNVDLPQAFSLRPAKRGD